MIENNESRNSLSVSHKILIFFGGLFIVMFAGFHYFNSIPGKTPKEKNKALILYYLGIVFWISLVAVIFYIMQ